MAFNNILKSKKKTIFVAKCDWCSREITLNGRHSDPFVINAEHKYFCIDQTPGYPADRDCLEDYLNDIKKRKNDYTTKKKLEKEKEEKQEKEEKAKRKEERKKITPKLQALLQEFKQREIQNRIKNH